MDSFFSPAVIWFIIGLVFFLLEFALPGFILFFFGIGAWLVAIFALFTDISLNNQVFVFLGSSLLSVLLFRNWARKKLGMMSARGRVLEDEFLGKVAKAETDIAPGREGKVYFKGTTWTAVSSDIIIKGDEVMIIGHESITLIVKSTKNK